jgi:signal transduction histidine kinase/ligand-binding sensor domain-containing protein
MSGWWKIWCLSVLAVWVGFPQTSYAQFPSFSSVGYTTENSGLSHNTVLNMFQDSRGFIWIGTMDGLNRFDGTNFKIYRHNPADSTTISDSFIHGIFEQSNGDLWIGTRDGGFTILDPVTDSITRINHRPDNRYNVPDKPANLMFEDSQGFFWMGFFTSSMGTFDDEAQKFIPMNIRQKITGEAINSINHVLELNDGAFLFSSINGLYYLPLEEIEAFKTDPGSDLTVEATKLVFQKENPQPEMNSLYVDENGTLWGELVGVKFEQAESFGFPVEVQKSLATGVAKTSAPNVIEEREDFLLIGGGGGYLHRIDKKTGDYQSTLVTEEEIVGSARLFIDNNKQRWFGTWGGGFYLLEEKKGIELFTVEQGLQSEFILGFAEEKDGLWIATNRGLAFLDKQGEITPYNTGILGMEETSIWSLWRDNLGLWVSTRFDGLYLISAASINEGGLRARNFNATNSLIESESVHQVMRDSRGWLWLGYQGEGVQIIKNPEAWVKGAPAQLVELINESSELSINSRSIRKFYEDEDNNVWIATTDNGYNYIRFSGNEITDIRTIEYRPGTEPSLSHRDGRSVYQQNDSTFWLASYGGGITRWRSTSNTLLNLRTNEGLANNSTYGILPDKNRRYIWVSTNNGISRLDTETLKFTTFTVADGLQNNEFNTGAYLSTSDRRLLFGGVGGFNVIDTEALSTDTVPPPVYITNVNVFNEPLNSDTSAIYKKQVLLPYDENFVSFEFAALDFTQPQYIQYAYKMQGVDEQWVQSGGRNFADYPNLEPGEYTFQVKAANSDGYWNETGASIAVTILPPWWQTIWFRLLAALSIIISFGLVIRHYSQRKLKQQIRKMEVEQKLRGERERISRDLHDHVGAQLANIMSGLSLVDKYNEFDEKEKSTELMNSLKSDAEVTIKQLRETIWALNQNALNLNEFADHLNTYFRHQSALTASLNVHIEVEKHSKVKLSSTQALNVFRIIQEASQNTLKYAGADHLWIAMRNGNNDPTISVKDDGEFKGEKSSFNGGYGMNNMQKRAREIDGTITFNTEKGTEVIIQIPLNEH